MKITDEQALRLRERLESMRECPLCGAHRYRFDRDVFALVGYEPDPDKPPGMVPVVSIACEGCGLLLMLSAQFHRLNLTPDSGQADAQTLTR